MTEHRTDLPSLQRSFAVVSTAFGVILGAIVVAAATLGGSGAAVRWVLPTAVVAGLELWVLHHYLDRNHPPATPEQRFDTLGPANLLTLGRGGILAGVAGFALLEPFGWVAWAPALLYGLVSGLDWVDGVLARMNERTTVLGERLDMTIDSLGFVVAPVVAVAWGRLPVWYLSLSAARYLYKAGIASRERRGLPVGELPDSLVRRPLAGLQMTFITVALLPVLPATVIHTVAPIVLLPSLLVFGRDYLVVAGHVGGQNNQY